MTAVDACIDVINDFYKRFYGDIDELKEKYINQYWICSNIKKKSLIERFKSDYDFLINYPDNLGIEKDDDRLKTINEYCEYFKSATILLSNDVFKSDFINPFTGEQAIPHDIVEAKMYLFDASSPKKAVERMNVLWQQKKELQKKDSNENSIKDEGPDTFNDIYKQFEDVGEGFSAVIDDLEYDLAFCDMTMKLGELAIASIEMYMDIKERDKLNSD